MRIRTATVVLLATGALLTACSSSDDDKPGTPAGDDKAAVVTAAETYTDAFFKPDAAGVYALLSARCQKATSVTEMRKTLAAATLMYGTPTVKSTEVNQLAGDMARVTVHYVKPPVPEKPQPWTREGGRWLFDGC